MKKSKFKEWLSTYIAKKPRTMILLGIFVFNLLFALVAAIIISSLEPAVLKGKGFGASLFYTFTMILDTGSIHEVIRNTGAINTIVTIVCVLVVLIGVLAFTGAIIGYVTNYISNFMDLESEKFKNIRNILNICNKINLPEFDEILLYFFEGLCQNYFYSILKRNNNEYNEKCCNELY